ncbi:nuclear transport factor 2 family protein [Aldersonia sp. NBC_00410]|uniref:nuclear transport factor 2 family protein n=1 Tax=Aldersonia sp. NBC_00410 TaxID=2975954 RepID=UPI0022536381|nr:nuclear transport factor 2 family protein [Aldersonia sp. NBC_00410]MCX5045857.1 nuclear transport factor 2 family protein [Aldersonia sp. NBC_00410]
MTTTETNYADLAAVRTRNEELWTRSSGLLFARRVDEFIETWCEDGIYEAALPVPGLDAVIAGRDALRAVFGGLTAAVTELGVTDLVFHQTADPDVAIIEEKMIGKLADGYTYENRLAIRVTFRDGKIAHMREYYGQFAHADLLRHLGFVE